jgi:hypothetical protein
MVAQILERLLFGRCAFINIHIIKADLLPRLAHFSFDYPKNNAIQSAYAQSVRFRPPPRNAPRAVAPALEAAGSLPRVYGRIYRTVHGLSR